MPARRRRRSGRARNPAPDARADIRGTGGVRYRYYVSQALLQNCKAEAGSIGRVPAPEVESLTCDGVRRQLAAVGRTEIANSFTDRELIERHVARVIIKPEALEVVLNPASAASAQV